MQPLIILTILGNFLAYAMHSPVSDLLRVQAGHKSTVLQIQLAQYQVGCQNCTRQAERRLEAIKIKLLEALGMKEVPPPPTEEMLDLARQTAVFSDFNERDLMKVQIIGKRIMSDVKASTFYLSDTEKSRKLYTSGLAVWLRTPRRASTLEELERSNIMSDADLRQKNGIVEIEVYQVYPDGTIGDLVSIRAKRPVPDDEVEVVYVPLIDSVTESWLRERDSVTLFVSAMYYGENLAIHPQDNDAYLKNSQLVLKLHREPIGQRRKRHAKCSIGEGEVGCCLYDFHVNFKAMGWNQFILLPETYNAFVCSGSCEQTTSSSFVNDRSMHASLTMYYTKPKNDKSSPPLQNCCHVTDFNPLTVVYIKDNATVVTQVVNNMVANKCGCA